MNSRILIEVHVTLEEFNSHLNCWILRLATRILIKTLKNFERILWENSDKIKDEFLNNSELLDNKAGYLEGQKGLMRMAWDNVMVSVGNAVVFTELETLMVVARYAIDRIIRTSVRFTKKAGRLKKPVSRTQMDRQHANSGSNNWDAKSGISEMARGVLDGGERQRDTGGIGTLQPD
jgi:hypothetical protein